MSENSGPNKELLLVGRIEMIEFSLTDKGVEEQTGGFRLFNAYVHKEHLPLCLFQTGESSETSDESVIPGLTHFMFNKEVQPWYIPSIYIFTSLLGPL